MQTKKFCIFITLSLVFALICGTTIISIASINDEKDQIHKIDGNVEWILRWAKATEGPLYSYSEAYTSITNEEQEYRFGYTYFRSSGDVNFSGGYYYQVYIDDSIGNNGSFRGSIANSYSHSTSRTLPEGEEPDVFAAVDSISAWNNIYGSLDGEEENFEAYSHVPF